MSTWLGIDIGASSVKVAVLRTAYRKTSLVGLAVAELSEGGPVEAVRAAALSALGEKPAIDGIAVAVDGIRASVHVLSFSQNVQRQLADVLPFELEAQLPFELDDAVFDHRVLGPKGDGQIAVLVGVARVEDVRARIDTVREALRLEPERVALGGLAYAQLVPVVPALLDPVGVALVDLGTRTSEVVVLKDGEPIYSRTLDFGTEGLPATASRLAREIRRSLVAHRAAGGAAPTKLFLAGGGAFVSSAEAFLSRELEMPVEVLPPPTLDMSVLPVEAAATLPRFAKSIALAMSLGGRSSLNLRRGPLAYERGFSWVKEKVPVLAGLAAVILVSLLFSTWARLHNTGKQLEAATSALGIVTKEVLGEATDSPAHATELLTQQTAGLDDDPMPHADAFDVMARLADAVPPSMSHDVEELDINKGHVTIHGMVGTIPEAQTIATNLQSEPCFSDVKVNRTTKAVGSERQKYVLEFDLKCPQDNKGKKKPDSAATAASAAAGGK